MFARSRPIFALIVVTLGSSTSSTAGTYQVVYDANVTWSQAQAAAAAVGGHLVTITSAGEQQLVETQIANSNPPREGAFWLGLRETTEGVYVWDNGEPLTYTNWYPGQPDNLLGVESRGQLMWSNDLLRRGRWNDISPDGVAFPNFNNDITRLGYVIEDGTPPVGVGVPALGGWGRMALMLSLVGLGSLFVLRRRRELA